MTSLDAALAAARRRLPAAEARLLLRRLLGCEAAWLASHGDTELEAAVEIEFTYRVERRAAGEPIAYLLGEREFYGRSFTVTADVLIPRPETELLVELSLQKLAGRTRPRLLELGTGSGCIAISLRCELDQAQTTAVDVSAAALAVAAENARRHNVDVEFRLSDWFAEVDGCFDLIVSNPPYIAAGDPHLGRGDLRFEPDLALSSGADGLDAIRRITAAAPSFLAAGGWLLLEHGCDQGTAVRNLMRDSGLEAIEVHQDLAGLDRVSAGCRPASASVPTIR